MKILIDKDIKIKIKIRLTWGSRRVASRASLSMFGDLVVVDSGGEHNVLPRTSHRNSSGR